MSVPNINSIPRSSFYLTPKPSAQNNSVSSEIKTTPAQPTSKTENKKSYGKKIALALGALAAAGVAIAMKVKKGKMPKSLSLDDFKNLGGKFDKGEAVLKNGKKFTGELISENKKGIFNIEYANGKLVKSTKNKKGHIGKISEKLYSEKDGIKTIKTISFDSMGKERGTLTSTIEQNKIVHEAPAFVGKNITTSTKQTDGSWNVIKKFTDMNDDENGPNNFYDYVKDMITGKIISKEKHIFPEIDPIELDLPPRK